MTAKKKPTAPTLNDLLKKFRKAVAEDSKEALLVLSGRTSRREELFNKVYLAELDYIAQCASKGYIEGALRDDARSQKATEAAVRAVEAFDKSA